MKNFITFLIVSMAIIFLFTSCGSSLTVTKRHHNKGYYVSYNKVKHSDRTSTIETPKEQELATNRNSEFNSSLSIDENSDPAEASQDVLPTEQTSENASPIDTKVENPEEANNAKSGNITSEKVHQSLTKIKKAFFEQKELITPDPREDGLSLLWIVILIILILWAIGFFGGSVGNVIHLLLVIALILLILWLLGII